MTSAEPSGGEWRLNAIRPSTVRSDRRTIAQHASVSVFQVEAQVDPDNRLDCIHGAKIPLLNVRFGIRLND